MASTRKPKPKPGRKPRPAAAAKPASKPKAKRRQTTPTPRRRPTRPPAAPPAEPPRRKYPSGRQKENARNARDAEERRGGKVRGAALEQQWLGRYSELGAPPSTVIGGMRWTHLVAVYGLHEAINDPALQPGQRRRLIVEFARAIGMTSVKAMYDADLTELKRRLGVIEEKGGSDAGDGT